ncbi:hypothetical protein [Adonisia turfae]|nr:hypothetical protein [Adonisia turfae]
MDTVSQGITMRTLAVIALLSVLTVAAHTSVRACYMDMGGERIDLSHICVDGSAPTDDDEPKTPARDELATFQVLQINTDGSATGRVSFNWSTPEGTTVWAYVVFMDGAWLYVGRATRTRDQRRVEIQFALPPGTLLSEVEGEAR